MLSVQSRKSFINSFNNKCDFMNHEDKIARMIDWHKKLLDMLQSTQSLPAGVDRKKLEDAYGMLESYTFRLVEKQ